MAREAVASAQFVQESVPERMPVERELYSAIEPVLGGSTVITSSASGLTLTELQTGWQDPARLVLGHPFSPPHLIPLVEVMGNERTDARAIPWARAFYESVGKVTIEVKREVPGQGPNRLQAALWREAIDLVLEGVASVEDVDTAVSAGPGAAVGGDGPDPAVPPERRGGRARRVLRALHRQLQPLVRRPRAAAPRPGDHRPARRRDGARGGHHLRR